VSWTTTERAFVERAVETHTAAADIAGSLKRPFIEVITFVHDEKIRPPAVPGPPPKIPRGAGYSKAQVASALGVMVAFDGNIMEAARVQKLNPDLLALALQRDGIGGDYLRSQAEHLKECPYCARLFFPTNASQEFCRKKCSADARRDESYFGGRRRETLGLLAGICQVCAAQPEHGISAHHIFGKENDPDDEYLIAVCSGCHDLLTRLGRRVFGVPHWEALITLASMRGGKAPRVEVHLKV
jgi:hypothetical protein